MNDEQDISTGNSSLDEILSGGLTPNRVYLLDGHPGTGKTTLALQFLLDGVRREEPGLYVSLSETRSELEAVAFSHGWSLEGVDIHELVDATDSLSSESQYTMFEPSEVELGETTQSMLDRVRRLNPKRVVLDSLSELRLLSQQPLRYRRQILALKQFFVGRECTVIFLDDKTSPDNDLQLQSIAHGVISLERSPSEYGREQRKLRVVKYRGRQYISGWHDFDIMRGGLKIYPRILHDDRVDDQADPPVLSSGAESLDQLLGKGIEGGTSTLMLGPAGVGKSSCATMFAYAACQRGERAAILCFDESRQTLLRRSRGLGMDLEPLEQKGLLTIKRINPGDITPGEFASCVRELSAPDEQGRRLSIVVVDSLNGYMSAMPEERFLQMQMHELLSYLGRRGVATFLLVAQHGLMGSQMKSPVDASYLADTVMLFRYFESEGEIRQAVSVVKKRDGIHERTIREFGMHDGVIYVGKPLKNFRGVLSGVPVFEGRHTDLLEVEDHDGSDNS